MQYDIQQQNNTHPKQIPQNVIRDKVQLPPPF